MLLAAPAIAAEKIQTMELAMVMYQGYAIAGVLMEGVFHFLKYCLQMHVYMIVNTVLIVEVMM